jgi:uncharacterized membrane protein
MQSINVAVLKPLFLGTFFGTAILCVAVAIAASLNYFVGSILVTMICNVPLNNKLASVKPDSTEGKTVWTQYLSVGTAWNPVRTTASLAAAACFILAIVHHSS